MVEVECFLRHDKSDAEAGAHASSQDSLIAMISSVHPTYDMVAFKQSVKGRLRAARAAIESPSLLCVWTHLFI